MAHPFVETKEMTVGYRGVPLIRDIALHVHRGEMCIRDRYSVIRC